MVEQAPGTNNNIEVERQQEQEAKLKRWLEILQDKEQKKLEQDPRLLSNPDSSETKKLLERIASLAAIKEAGTAEERTEALTRAIHPSSGCISVEEGEIILGGKEVPVTPEELEFQKKAEAEKKEKEKLRAWMYRLIMGKAPGEKTPEDFKPTEDMERTTAEFLKTKDKWIQNSTDAVRLKKELATLEKKRDKMERDGDPTIAAAEREIIFKKNQIRALDDPEKLAEELEKAKEAVKARLIDEFRKEKGKIIKAGYEARGENITEEELNKLLADEIAKEYLPRVMLEMITQLDQSLENERLEAVGRFEEKSWWKKTLKRWQDMPFYKRLGASGAIAGGFGFATALVFPPSAIALGLGTAGFVGYRVLRGTIGAGAGILFNKAAQKLTSWFFGKKRAGMRQEQIGETSAQIQGIVDEAGTWLNDEGKKKEVAKLIDEEARRYREKINELAFKEKWTRRGVGVIAGLAGGLTAGYGLDALVGRGLPTMTIFDALDKSKKAPEVPVVGGGGIHPSMFYDLEAESASPDVTPRTSAGGAVDSFVDIEGSGGWLDTPSEIAGEKPSISTTAGAGTSVASALGEPTPGGGTEVINNIVMVKPGGGVWKALEQQIDARGKFAGLNEAQKTYIIDALKDEIGKDPKKWLGLADINKVRAGQTLDFTKFWNENSELLNHSIEHAKNLTKSQIGDILTNNEKLNEWVSAHKGQALTPGKIEEILGMKKVAATPPIQGARVMEPFPVEEPQLTESQEVPETAGGALLVEASIEKKSPIGVTTVSEATKTLADLSPLEEAFGSKIEVAISQATGLSLGQYGVLREISVEKLLAEIPSSDVAWTIWRGEVPDKVIDLPSYGWFYGPSEFGRQIRLAEFIHTYTDGLLKNSPILKMTISQFLQQLKMEFK